MPRRAPRPVIATGATLGDAPARVQDRVHACPAGGSVAKCYRRPSRRARPCRRSAVSTCKRASTLIDFDNKGFLKLKRDDKYAEMASTLLIEGEKVIDAYRSMRDGVVFTDRRIISINVQGITGSKKDFTSLPYRNIVAYSVETSGTFDLDSELEIYFSSLGKVKFEFTGSTAIEEVSRYISQAIL